MKLTSKIILLLLTPFLSMLPDRKAQAFVINSPLINPPPVGHEAIDSGALGFLRSTIRDDTSDEHMLQDLGNSGDDFLHFDNSNFTEGVKYINSQYSTPRNRFGAGGVIAELDPRNPQPFDATDEFGQLLHTAQDFYAHSNWVDYDPTNVPLPGFARGKGLWTVPTPYGTVDRGGGVGQLLVLQGTPPAGSRFTITPTTIGPRGLMRLVDVAGDPSGVTKGLVSGGSPNDNSKNQAPPGAKIAHGTTALDWILSRGTLANDDATTLNKDHPGLTFPLGVAPKPARSNYQAAFNAATRQTEQEWCRLLHLTKGTHGLPGASIPMAFFVAPSGNPHPSGTDCSPTTPATQRVQVTINSIKVLNDTDPFSNGELNFSFVLYTDDFTRSVRHLAEPFVSIEDVAFVPAANIPAPLILGVTDPNKLVITLQSWDDDNASSSLDKVFDSSDEILKGITRAFPGVGVHKATSNFGKDLEICYTVTLLPNRAPERISSNAADANASNSSGCLDFGDAPDSYRTLAESGGPRYLEGDSQRLGRRWDNESDGEPTLLADGDDTGCGCNQEFTEVDDEDGVIFGNNFVDITFNITRPGENLYQLRAWWDINKNGFFDHLSELFIDDLLTLSPGMTIKRYTLPFDPRLFYSRFRLTWNPVDLDVKPWDEYKAADGISYGEVEDYAPRSSIPSVPESSSVLSLLTFGALGVGSTLKRKQKPSD